MIRLSCNKLLEWNAAERNEIACFEWDQLVFLEERALAEPGEILRNADLILSIDDSVGMTRR